MATVSTLLTNLGYDLNDPNAEIFTSAIKLVALNEAQRELVLKILAFNPNEFEGIYDLFSEIVEEETKSVGTTGFAFSGLSNRNILRNGFINSRVTLNGEFKYPVRYTIDNFGMTENSFLAGSDDYPVARIIKNKYYIDLDVGSYPINVTMWYVGEPYELASTASGSGPTQKVTTPDLNVIMHDLIVKIAERDLRRGRGDPTDFAEAKEIQTLIDDQVMALVRGQISTPKSGTVGQFTRENAAQRS